MPGLPGGGPPASTQILTLTITPPTPADWGMNGESVVTLTEPIPVSGVEPPSLWFLRSEVGTWEQGVVLTPAPDGMSASYMFNTGMVGDAAGSSALIEARLPSGEVSNQINYVLLTGEPAADPNESAPFSVRTITR